MNGASPVRGGACVGACDGVALAPRGAVRSAWLGR